MSTANNEQEQDQRDAKVIGHAMLPVTQGFLEDVMCGAFEGGSNYWIDFAQVEVTPKERTEYVHQTPCTEDGKLRIFIYEPEGISTDEQDYTEGVVLDRAMLIKGYEKYIAFMQTHERDIPMGSNRDADHDDMILQFALFGEVIFG